MRPDFVAFDQVAGCSRSSLPALEARRAAMTDLAAAKTLHWDAGDPAHAHTLPSRYFYDAGVFAAERERIFYRAWHAVGHVNELTDPGSFLTQDIFDQSVIVLAGRDGEVRAFHNVCQHRGNRLLLQRRGKLSTVIR